MPRKAVKGERRLAPLSMKTTDALRQHLENEASRSGRTLTHEVEYRLERSFADDHNFTTPTNAAILRDLARFLQLVGFNRNEDSNKTCRRVLLKCFEKIIEEHLSSPKQVRGLLDAVTGGTIKPDPFDSDPERAKLFEDRCLKLVEAVVDSSKLPELTPSISPPVAPFGFGSTMGNIDSDALAQMGFMPPSPVDLSAPPTVTSDKSPEAPGRVRRSVNKKNESK